MPNTLNSRTIMPSIRLTNFGVFAFCTTSMLIAFFYFQKTLNLEPCPLCMSQRIIMISTGVIALLAFAHHPKTTGRRIYAALGVIVSAVGIGIAARHNWLQSLPADQVPTCGPGLAYMFDTLPIFDAVRVLFKGDGNCAEVVWSLFGLSIPGWTLIAFTGLTGANLWQLFRKA